MQILKFLLAKIVRDSRKHNRCSQQITIMGTQGKSVKVISYIKCFSYIMHKFTTPHSTTKQTHHQLNFSIDGEFVGLSDWI